MLEVEQYLASEFEQCEKGEGLTFAKVLKRIKELAFENDLISKNSSARDTKHVETALQRCVKTGASGGRRYVAK